MMLIPCPWCGERSAIEFFAGGERTARRPADPAAMSDAEWRDWLTIRANRRGLHEELWQHVQGCGAWFVVERDTATHEIAAARPLGE